MVTERSQPNGVKLKMRERKLRIGANRQGGLRAKKAQNSKKGAKQTDVKQGVYFNYLTTPTCFGLLSHLQGCHFIPQEDSQECQNM